MSFTQYYYIIISVALWRSRTFTAPISRTSFHDLLNIVTNFRRQKTCVHSFAFTSHIYIYLYESSCKHYIYAALANTYTHTMLMMNIFYYCTSAGACVRKHQKATQAQGIHYIHPVRDLYPRQAYHAG